MAPILEVGKSYTFPSYFEMAYEPEDILAELGYGLQRQRLDLAKFSGPLEQSLYLQGKLQQRLTYVSLTREAARREILMTPILLEVAEVAQAQLRIEYSLQVTDQLRGSLDYYLYKNQQLLGVDAKNADLTKGFTQLAVEFIALDQSNTQSKARSQNNHPPILLGAVNQK